MAICPPIYPPTPIRAHPSRSYTDATDANATNTRLRANRPTPKHPPTKRLDLKHERTRCSRPSGRPPKPPNMRRQTHADASRRSPTHAAEGVVAVAVVVVRHAVERRADQPATQASRQTSNEQTNHHDQHNKQTNIRRRHRRTILADNNTTLYHGRHRRERYQHEAPGEPSNSQTPANQAARS